MIKLNPYLNFADNAEEAANFYKEALNGEILMQMQSALKNIDNRYCFAANLNRYSN